MIFIRFGKNRINIHSIAYYGLRNHTDGLKTAIHFIGDVTVPLCLNGDYIDALDKEIEKALNVNNNSSGGIEKE
jgi:hypothetical protein